MKIQIHQSGPSRAGYVFPLVSGDAGVCIVNPTQPKLAAAAGAKKKHQSRPLWWRARNNLHNATCRLAAHTNAGVHLIIQVPIGKRARTRAAALTRNHELSKRSLYYAHSPCSIQLCANLYTYRGCNSILVGPVRSLALRLA